LVGRRRTKILEQPFPQAFREILIQKVKHYNYLDSDERMRLEQLVQVFIEEKNFEGCGGLELNDEVRVVISAQACMLIFGLNHDLYRKVSSILVYPSTVLSPSRTGENPMAILGEAHMNGPVILVWDDVKRGAIHPERGHNVVYHEFAHKLDMLDGAADGAPPLETNEQYVEWERICSSAYKVLSRKIDRGKRTFLDPYGATNPAEFFAVATEYFFDKPIRMQSRRRPLYELLQDFYKQDPAEREKRYRASKGR
jgi:MtfA peptidase